MQRDVPDPLVDDDPEPGPRSSLRAVDDGPPAAWSSVQLALPGERPVRELAFCGLGYRGARHGWNGKPDSSKTTLAYIALLEDVRAGSTVVVFDFEMGAYDARDRLRDLGCTSAELERIHFFEPTVTATAEIVANIADRLEPTLVLIDAAAGAYELQGLDDSKRGDVEKWSRTFIRPLKTRGIASIVIDHVVKNDDARGLWAIGSERKLGGVDVGLTFAAKTLFTRGGTGVITVTVGRDRFGYLPRPRAAEIELHSDPTTHAITWTFREPQGDEADEAWQPTALMEKVSRHLAQQPEPQSRSAIARNVTGKRDYVLLAIDQLLADGYAAESKGERGARLVTHLRPFPDPSPPFPGNGSLTSPPFPPPTGGERGRVDDDEIERLAALATETETT